MNKLIDNHQPALTADQLKLELSQFTGTETWYRHPLSPQMLYTDGV